MDISESLKEFCQGIDTAIDYFLIIGLPKQTIQAFIQSDSPTSPQILSQFPQFTRKENQLPQQLQIVIFTQFLCPFSLKIVDGSTRTQNSVYSTIISNPQGKKLYCSCLKFYQFYNPEDPEQTINIQQPQVFQTPFEIVNQFSSDDLQTRSKSSTFLDSPNPARHTLFDPRKFLVPKVIVLISRAPFFRTSRIILKKLYEMFKTQLNLPMELYISQLVLQVPMPPKGQTEVLYQLMNHKVIFSIPPCNKLPILDLNIGLVFHILDLQKIITIFTIISLERSVVFISNEQQKIFDISHIFLSFLHPFHWTMIYVPLLPELIMSDLLGSPVNFVYGANVQFKQEILSICESKTYIVDLDTNQILNGKSRFSISSNQKLPSMTHHYAKKLIERLQQTLRKIGAKKPDFRLPTKKLDPFTTDTIRNLFLQFYAGLFSNYKRYLIFNQHSQTLFDKRGFLHQSTDNSKPYLSQLMKTQMFANFIQSRIHPQSVQEYCQDLFFDQTISAKHNRSHFKRIKQQTPFMSDRSQDHHQKYQVKPIHQQHLSQYSYTYQNFPLFDISKLQQSGIPASPPPLLAENSQLPVQNFTITTRECKTDTDCILVCWFQMWAACLPSQHQRDLQNRLDQLLKTLRKAKTIPKPILSQIYKLLLQVTGQVNPHLSIPIYQVMSQTSVLMDAATTQILQKTVQQLTGNRQIVVMKSTGHSLQLANILNQEIAHQQFTKRKAYVRRLDTRNSIQDSIRFQLSQTCQNCRQQINIQNITWKRIQTDFQIECPTCKTGFFPNLKVYIWDGQFQNLQQVVFASPQVLKSLVSSLLAQDQNKQGLNLPLFRTSNLTIFWNLVWHFTNQKLPYQFMLPLDQNSTIVHHQIKMSTLEQQQSEHDASGESVLLVDAYLYFLFGYIFLSAGIAGLIIFISYKKSKKIELQMIIKVDYSVRIIAGIQFLNILILLPFATTFFLYAKLVAEFVAAIISFFVREHQLFRWICMVFLVSTIILNILFMRSIMPEIYCSENETCNLDLSLQELKLVYSQYAIGFILEVIEMILISNLMMSLGWFYTKRFPPQLNLESYGIKRPKKKANIYDLFPHPIIYE